MGVDHLAKDHELGALSAPLRDYQKEFDALIAPHRSALWRYCRMVTGSPWDAEDLVQETLLKAYATLPKLWQPVISKAFLFRIATNTWLNQMRKTKFLSESPIEDHDSIAVDADPFETREAMERLIQFLPSRQAVVVLLCDVFKFRANEVAGMVETSEGAVKALLHRARTKLQTLREQEDLKEPQQKTLTKEQVAVVEAYLSAFNQRDPDAIARLMDDHVVTDIVNVSEEHGKAIVRDHSLADWAKDPMPMWASLRILWNKPAIVVMTKADDEDVLYDLIELEIENGAITKKKDYYFCQDLLKEAGKALNVPVHLNGYVYGG